MYTHTHVYKVCMYYTAHRIYENRSIQYVLFKKYIYSTKLILAIFSY